jgi:putative DNA primase/helicase
MSACSHNHKVALQYARAGLAVFPCKQDKKPLVDSWPNTATTDEQKISAWWQQWPAALIGLPLKQIDCLVIDADRHNPDEDGVARLRALCEGKELPPHPIVLTANNGEHRFFKQPSWEKISNRKFDVGLETRGFRLDNDGGYVIAAGSRLSDGRCWQLMEGAPRLSAMLENGGLPEAPPWLIEIIRPRPKGIAPNAGGQQRQTENREVKYAQAALAHHIDDLARAQPGKRNNELNKAAYALGSMVARGWLAQQEVVDGLWQASVGNGLVGDDGVDSVQKTLTSGLEAGLANPHANRAERPFNGRSKFSGYERQQPSSENARLISRCAAEIEPKRIDFLWPGRLARGKHTAIAGEPGDGKSQLSVYVAATISRGGEWPCGEGRAPIGNVIIFNAEDGADDTVVPRLIAAGADLKRVHIVSAVLQEDGKGRRTFNLQADLALLERKIAEIGDVVLVIIDPISSYMGKTDSHKNAEVRGALEPLSEMAGRLKVAILSITHFSKVGAGNNSKALHRFIGSIAFVGAPRAAFAVIEDADNEGRILFLHAKTNMGAKPQGLAYRLVQTLVDGEAGQDIVASYVVWDNEPVVVSADEALRATDGCGDRAAAVEAEEFLRDKLSGGPVAAKEGEEHARALGIAPRTLARARKNLGVIAEKVGLKDGWTWRLPSEGHSTPERRLPPEGCQAPAKNAIKKDGSLRPALAAFESNHTTQLVNNSVPSALGPEGVNGPGLCAQCHGRQGAVPTLHTGVGYPPEGVWLHQECVRS